MAECLLSKCSLVLALQERLEQRVKCISAPDPNNESFHLGVGENHHSLLQFLQNFIPIALGIGPEDLKSSPLLKWSVYNLSGFEHPEYTIRSFTLTHLWKEAVRHGLRARRVMESTLSVCFLLCCGFHNDSLENPNWKKSLNLFQQTYSYLWFLGLSTSYMKYHTASLFCLLQGQSEYPPAPKWSVALFSKRGMFLTGVGYKYIQWLKQQSSKNLTGTRLMNMSRISSTFLHLKRGLPPVHPFELREATADWYVQLSKRKGVLGRETRPDYNEVSKHLPTTFEKFFSFPVSKRRIVLAAQVKRTVEELFPWKEADLSRFRIPSGSSHFERQKFEGGAYTQFQREIFGNEVDFEKKIKTDQDRKGRVNQYFEVKMGIADPQHSNLKGCPLIYGKGLCPKTRPVPIKSLLYRWQQDEKTGIYERTVDGQYQARLLELGYLTFPDAHSKECISNEIFEISLRSYVYRPLARALARSKNSVLPVALPEPLKVRLISRGPWARYYVGSAVQRYMHETLRYHPTFAPIGSPITQGFLDDRLGFLRQGFKYLSGDYKAATDLIDPFLSTVACEAIADQGKFPEWMRDILIEGLTGASLEFQTSDNITISASVQNNLPRSRNEMGFYWPDGASLPFVEGGAAVTQTWGQLMGSPLSFPVLCIVNAAVNRYFLELMFREIDERWSPKDLKDFPMLINGDDILMTIDEKYYPRWKDFIVNAGLVPSVGKNYVSEKFVIINSTYYQVDECMTGPCSFTEQPYINTGLLHPTENDRSSISDDFSLDPTVWDLGQCSKKLIRNQSYEIQDRLMSIFIGDPFVKGTLGRLPRGVSYYASKTLGGMGLARTRNHLLSEAQLGYYTRIACTRGEIAPKVPSTYGLSKDVAALYDMASCTVLSEDWDLLYDSENQVSPSGPLWEAYDSKQAMLIPYESHLAELNKKCDVVVNGVRRKRTQAGIKGIAPVASGLLRAHTRAWPESVLCDFPWGRKQIKSYDLTPQDDLHMMGLSSMFNHDESLGIICDAEHYKYYLNDLK